MLSLVIFSHVLQEYIIVCFAYIFSLFKIKTIN